MTKLPLIRDVVAQDLFIKHQLKPQNEVFVDAPSPYEVKLSTVSKVFKFKFSDQVDKRDDFTIVGKEAVLKIHGSLTKFYSRGIIGSGINEYAVQLSPISLQNTFLSVKQRIQKALDIVCENEGIAEVPDIMIESCRFRELIYNSMDRIGKVVPKETRSFELVFWEKAKRDKESLSYGLYIHPDGSK